MKVVLRTTSLKMYLNLNILVLIARKKRHSNYINKHKRNNMIIVVWIIYKEYIIIVNAA